MNVFLRLACDMPLVEGMPWPFCSEGWREKHGEDVPPWAPRATVANTGLSQETLDAVKTFATKFSAQTTADAEQFSGRKEDNFAAGRTAAAEWLSRKVIAWGLTKFMDEQLEMFGFTVYKVTGLDFKVGEAIH